MLNSPSKRLIYDLNLKEGDKVQVSRDTIFQNVDVISVQDNLAKVKFSDGFEENINVSSARFYPLHCLYKEEDKLDHLKASKEHSGKIVKAKIATPKPKIYQEHVCSPTCSSKYFPFMFRNRNPFQIPLLLGWTRDMVYLSHKEKSDQRNWKVVYRSPCGVTLRSMREVDRYLIACKNDLGIDCFCFDPWLSVLDEFEPLQNLIDVPDLSNGKEFSPIPAVNVFDTSTPEIDYITDYSPQGDVNIPFDTNFLSRCDCTDNCSDNVECPCGKLSVSATALDQEGEIVLRDAGFDHRRLKNIFFTGIFECNSLCKCPPSCHNKVSQRPIQVKLQVFKTAKRGWGVRALHDIPEGIFVCKYVGNLYNSSDANILGEKFGDDYFCELDLIEIVQQGKEGYESDVTDIEDEDEKTDDKISRVGTDKESSEIIAQNQTNGSTNTPTCEKSTENPEAPASQKEKRNGDDEPCKEEQPPKKKFKSIRKLYPENEREVYLIDAMKSGNVGRYLNHSCDPNIYVQNVFQETHDLRFPTVAFFTCRFVRAGEELCWNYDYEVGSVPGRRIDCHCGAQNCRQRLL